MFKNATIVSRGIHPKNYHKPTAERGAREFIVSSSSLRAVFAKSPKHWFDGWELPESASLEYGSLIDCILLTPDQFKSQYAFEPAEYKNEKGEVKPWSNNAKVCRAWNEDQKTMGLEIISDKEYSNAKAAVSRLWGDEQIKMFLDACDKQVWIQATWEDKATGLEIPVQCLIDLAGRPDTQFRLRLGDLKTTKNAQPVAWSKWADFAGYDIQAAWNIDLYNAATGQGVTDFCFILSESFSPWEIGRRYMTQDALEPGQDSGSIASGRRQYTKMMANYCKFIKNGFWPGYDDTDESSESGWTLVTPDPWSEQRRMFAPQFTTGEDQEQEAGQTFEEEGEVTP